MIRIFFPILLFLLGGLPFAFPYLYQPNPVFRSEVCAFILALFITLLALTRRTRAVPLTTLYWLGFAFVICLQLIFQTSVFYQNKIIALFFLFTAAGLSYAINYLKEEIGLSLLTDCLLLGMIVGAAINTGIAFAQVYYNITTESSGSIISGIGQRNMYGNYLMGSYLGLLYLAQKYRLRWWIVALPIAWFALSLGWAGSRSILLYLAMVLIMASYAFWRHPHLRQLCRWLFIGVIIAVAAQLTVPYINEFIGWLTGHGGDTTTALERLTSNGARRLVEWQKALMMFKNNPLLGVGWSGYAANSMQLHALYPAFYQVVESNLFTQAHNSALNILAETGIAGAIFILGGYLVLLLQIRLDRPEKLILLLVLFVATLHSLVEYPLWYFHFLAIFVVALALLVDKQIGGRFLRSVSLVYIIFAITCASWACVAYWQLSHLRTKSAGETRQTLLELMHNPLVDFYASHAYTVFINADKDDPDMALPILTRVNQFRPYPWPLMDEAILQARIGNQENARQLLHLGIYGYPDSLPYFERKVKNSAFPEVRALMPEIEQGKKLFRKEGARPSSGKE